MSDYKQIVTLTTDWMDKSYYARMLEDMNLPKIYPVGDHYVAQLKACLRQLSSEIEIFDICNTVQAFSVLQTGYILRTTYPFFPKGSIHLIGVNSEPTETNKILVVEHDGHYFAGSDNGVYSIVFEDSTPESVYELVPEMLYKYVPDLAPKSFFGGNFSGFSAIKIFTTVINHIMSRQDISQLGIKSMINKEKTMLKAICDKDGITGRVMFIDHFGNIITNITREQFDSTGKGRPFRIYVRGSKRVSITTISASYNVVEHGQKYLAIFNSSGALEIAQLEQNLAQLENIDEYSTVYIKFVEEGGNRLFY
ncbi:MAG: SAM-dependent chlorinase/fluorinase [Prevotellaceae bacterium]|jgi:S-adenosylmethionine hydrolase|nr:SAM-dependent chlorinase/fluorinase [Prevotellaceae bacterium]